MGIYVEVYNGIVTQSINAESMPEGSWIEIVPGEVNKIAFVGDVYDPESNMFFTPVAEESI